MRISWYMEKSGESHTQHSMCEILKDSEARRTSRTGRVHAPLTHSSSWWKTGEWQELCMADRNVSDWPRSLNHQRLGGRSLVGRGSPVLQWGMMPAGGEAVPWRGAVKMLLERLEQHQWIWNVMHWRRHHPNDPVMGTERGMPAL